MDSIPHYEYSAYLSPMGLILPVALAAALLLLTTVWKPARETVNTRLFVQAAIWAAALCWVIVWGAAVQDHDQAVDKAAEETALIFQSGYGIRIDPEDARDIVTDTLGDRTFKGGTEDGSVYLLSGTWEDNGFHLNTVGQAVSVLPADER